MKPALLFLLALGCGLSLAACSDDTSSPGASAGSSGELEAGADAAGASEAGAGADGGGKGGAATASGGSSGGGSSGAPSIGGGGASIGLGGESGQAGEGGEAGSGNEVAAWYRCQSSDQAFVRRAILGVLGRRAFSQSEVDVYTQIIQQIDAADGLTDEQKLAKPETELRHSRKVVLEALFKRPEYAKHWADLYRDYIRVQRIEELANKECFATPLSEDPVAAAAYVRDQPANASGSGNTPFNMYDVIAGSMALDDMTPIYTANLFAMLSKTYLGANALPAALELTRRRDFGAWFDASYLHRDTVCLGCHNSEFSVTASADPKLNRHFPLPALLEKSLFGDSTGPATFGGYEGGDREHAPLRFDGFVNSCSDEQYTKEQADMLFYDPGCATADEPIHFCATEAVCESDFVKKGRAKPWGWAEACGRYLSAEQVPVDIAEVEAKFGNVTGVRTSPWGLADSLRAGFEKMRGVGLEVDPDTLEVPDPDQAFAYLVAMTVSENVWLEIVGTPLTIPTRFPRNAAARDQLAFLANTFVRSGFSNQKLLEAVFASPYLNLAAPNEGCGEAFAAPAVFDPWVIADQDPIKRKNSAADAVVSLTTRTAASALYAALGWDRPSVSAFPDTYTLTQDDPQAPLIRSERQFQSEVGFYLKSSEPGFRGFDFQARLGWENRFATCSKLAGEEAPDFVDQLVASVNSVGKGTARDLVLALKDRMIGQASIDDAKEKPALEAVFGSPLDADASTVPDLPAGLRKVCGVVASSAQFLLMGIPPADASSVPKLTPTSASYASVCASVASAGLTHATLTCNADSSLTVALR
jgi:hypothetical protein